MDSLRLTSTALTPESASRYFPRLPSDDLVTDLDVNIADGRMQDLKEYPKK